MANLNPAPAQLGLASPVVGAWFDDDSLSLAAPGARLSVALSFDVATAWWPPAAGTLTLAVSTPARPPALRGLTDGMGEPAFDDDKLVALFKLLPEVEERLDALSAMLPRPDGVGAGGGRTRARVRAIAIECPDRLGDYLDHFVNPTGEDDALAFGLVRRDDGTLDNGALPMSDLKRPGQFPALARQVLADFPAGQAVTVWAFDADGQAIDPGAVAAWWAAMADGSVAPWIGQNSNLWAENDNQRTCAVADHLGFRLVNPHRGMIDANLQGRLTLQGATQVGGNASLYRAADANGASVTFSAAPAAGTPDTVPIPMAALLPIGTYAAGPLNLWNGVNPAPLGPVTLPAHAGGNVTLARDFVEVAVLDVESFVCGTVRGPNVKPGTPAEHRSSDQNRASTRINVTRSTVALLATLDGVANAFTTLPDGVNPVSIIAPAFDHDWGARLVENLPASPPPAPTVLPALSCFALAGGGQADGDTVGEQKVVIRIALPMANVQAGAWVRIYPQKINLDTGRREPLPGGAGRFGRVAAGANTLVAHVVVTLPAGRTDGAAQLGVDVMLVPGVTAAPASTVVAPTVYADQRITRPAPVDGAPVGFADISAELGAQAMVLDCDQGVEVPPDGVPQGVFRSGSTLLVRVPGSNADGDAFTLIDRASVPLGWFDNATLAKTLTASDVVAVTTPAFVNQARGNLNPFDRDRATAIGFAVQDFRVQSRNILTVPLGTGAPLLSQERLELAGLRNAGSAAGAQNIAVVGSAPALAAWHELLPAQAGNPTAPGGAEVHAAGVQITGGAVTDVADVMRDRLITDTVALIRDAGSNPLPTQTIAAPAQWAAVLKTVARGVEGEPGVFEAIDLTDRALFDSYDKIATALQSLNLPAAGGLANINAALRAACRRILNALGRQEALFALNAAIARAERLVYIETPAIDGEPVEAGGTALAWLATLVDRLDNRPGLHVALCVPRELLPGMPAPLAWVRNALWQRALADLSEAAGERLVVFSPGAGPFSHVRMASTVVVVDDVWAMVGNTHLWRRGLSFDASLAVAVFDEANRFGRGAAVSAFRTQLAADRLGVANTQVPLVGHEFVATLRRLAEGGGAGRLSSGAIVPSPGAGAPSSDDSALWNTDGSKAILLEAVAGATLLHLAQG